MRVLAAIFIAGWAAGGDPVLAQEAIGETSFGQSAACPVISGQDWRAGIVEGPEGRLLRISGSVVLPTPGHELRWTAGLADRSARPAQRIELEALPPEGMVVQMLDSREVSFEMPALAAQYRSVTVRCGGVEVVRFGEVSAAEAAGITGRGNEPGWSVKVTGGRVVLETGYGAQRQEMAVTGDRDEAGTRVVTAEENGAPVIEIRKRMGLCFDTMSGAPFPYTVEVRTGERRFEGCGGETAEVLAGPAWRVEDIGGAGMIDGAEVTLRFQADGGVEGSGGCNGFRGSWTMVDGRIGIGPLAVTRRACASVALMSQEAAFFAVLTQPLTAGDAPGGLLLTGADGGSVTLRR